MIRTKHRGEVMPKGFGHVIHDPRNDLSLIAPIGLNVLFAAAYFVWAWITYGIPSALERRLP